jgi:hypothetical protein
LLVGEEPAVAAEPFRPARFAREASQ